MRLIALIVVALLSAAVVVVPGPPDPIPGPPATPAPATFAVCPIGEAARRDTIVDMVGGAGGEVMASVFSAGEVVAEDTVAVSADGSSSVVVSDLSGLARSPVLVGLPEAMTRVEAVLRGDGLAAARCSAGSADTVMVTGGSTSEGETFQLLLANPFAGTATISLSVASEVGTESNPDLERVVVPPHSLVAVDLSGQLPGRQVMSVAVTPEEGRVVAGAIQAGSGDVAADAAQVAGVDWFLPVPQVEGVGRSLVLAAPGTADVPYQLDVYDSDGLIEAVQEGTVPARGQAVIPISDLLQGEGVVRVVAAAPVAAVLRLSGEGARALVPGVPATGTSWVLPGAGRLGTTDVHVFNPGVVDVAARLLTGGGEELDQVNVSAGTWVTLQVPQGTTGVRVDGDGDLVVTWTTATEEGLAGDAAQMAG